MKKGILLILLIFILSISFVNASENTTDLKSVDDAFCENYDIDSKLNQNYENNYNLMDDNKHSDIYIDNSVEVSGDGLSPETPMKHLDNSIFNKLSNNGTVHLANGEYEIPNNDEEYTIVGNGQNTVITKCWFETSSYINSNKSLTLINLTFKIPSKGFVGYMSGDDDNGLSYTSVYYDISLDGKNFNFIGCTFVNVSFVSGQWQYNNPNRDKLTDISSAIFENCNFINYSYDKHVNEYDTTTYGGTKIHNMEYESKNLITSYAYSKYTFNNCNFENLVVDAIVDSYGGQTDHYGRFDGVYIHNSNFKNCNMNGIVKARQLGSCEIVDCTYDFDASETVDLVSPFYVNKTIKSADLNETQLTVTAKDNSVIITLTDVNANKPIAGVEVAIINNNKVFAYRDTDSNGQIVLDNLLGTYNFEFSYPGDEYVGYAPTSLNKTLTFNKTKINTVIQAPKVTATYNVAKNLVITLKDANGNVLVGKYVTVKVGTISKNIQTDKKGQVSVNVATLVPKSYTASISFAGDDDYNKASTTANVVVGKATPKLTAKAKTFKKSVKTKKYTVTLKTNLNKVMKNVKVTIKVNKKTYSAKTNSKGVATFKITKLTKKGTFTATVKFVGNKNFKATTKKVKIVVKK